MKCPRDGSDLVERRFVAGVTVDVCGRCRGVWLDDGELKTLQAHGKHDAAADPAPDVVAQAREMAEQRASGPASCPRCGAEMVTAEYARASQIVVDSCPAGCGMWLDAGELHAIEAFCDRARAEAATEDDALWKIRGLWASLRGRLRR